jgi:hypothetical protein
MTQAAQSPGVAEKLAALGLSVTRPPGRIDLPSGTVIEIRPLGAADEAAAMDEAARLIGRPADRLRQWHRRFGFAYDVRELAAMSEDASYVEAAVQYTRAVLLAARIAIGVTRAGRAVEPDEGLFAALFADNADLVAFLTQAIPPRLVDQAASERVRARAAYLWAGGGKHCDTCKSLEKPCATTGNGCPLQENAPVTAAERAAAEIMAHAGVWLRGGMGGRVGLDWAGARAVCPPWVPWEQVHPLLAVLESAFVKHAADEVEAAQEQQGVEP